MQVSCDECAKDYEKAVDEDEDDGLKEKMKQEDSSSTEDSDDVEEENDRRREKESPEKMQWRLKSWQSRLFTHLSFQV